MAGDSLLEIDNSAAERALRTVALGRKNFLFVGTNGGGELAAAMSGHTWLAQSSVIQENCVCLCGAGAITCKFRYVRISNAITAIDGYAPSVENVDTITVTTFPQGNRSRQDGVHRSNSKVIIRTLPDLSSRSRELPLHRRVSLALRGLACSHSTSGGDRAGMSLFGCLAFGGSRWDPFS